MYAATAPTVPDRTDHLLRSPTEVDALPPLDLSDRFDPFLRHFARETLGCGGEVRAVREGEKVVALVLADPAENVASVFARSVPVAEAIVRARREPGVFSEVELDLPKETFDIYTAATVPTLESHRFRHRVRIARAAEIPAVLALMKETYRGFNELWFRGIDPRVETCFTADVDGTVAGVGWISVVGSYGRLHSLTVRTGYRRLGIGLDLLFARLGWAHARGVRTVLSEIAERNTASKAIAERGGMRPAGRIYLYGKG